MRVREKEREAKKLSLLDIYEVFLFSKGKEMLVSANLKSKLGKMSSLGQKNFKR